MSETGLLRAEGLTVAYGATTVLRDVSFGVQSGETVTLLGANGAGKSTLARACSGLVPVAAGRIWFDGHDITRWPAHRIRRAGLVLLPEGRGILPGLSVLDNLRMAVSICDRDEKKAAIARACELFPVLRERLPQRAGYLSGGEQQMLSLARALCVPAKLILADELSLGLAPKIVDVVFESLQRAKELGVTVVIIEQFIHRALRLSDTCLILRRGQLVWSGLASAAEGEAASHYIGDRPDVSPDAIAG